jgi:hypothetical protein
MSVTAQTNEKRPRRYRKTEPYTRELILTMAASKDELSAKQIADQLAVMDLPGEVPDLRTIQNIAAKGRPRRPDEPWTLLDPRASADESRVVLETLGSLGRLRGGSVVLSVTEAEWIARLSEVAPWLHPFERYVDARRFVAAIEQDSRTDELTYEIALQRPESPEQASQTFNVAMRQAYAALKEQRKAEEQR